MFSGGAQVGAIDPFDFAQGRLSIAWDTAEIANCTASVSDA